MAGAHQMLETTAKLPQGALLDVPCHGFDETLSRARAIWLRGQVAQFDLDKQSKSVIGWRALVGDMTAVPTEPNEQNTHLATIGDATGLQCITAEHCGLVVPDIIEDASLFTMAIVYVPPAEGEARTLLTLNSGYSGGDSKNANYLFVSDSGGMITAKDTKGSIELNTPATTAPGQPRLLTVSLSRDQLAVQENMGAVHLAQGAVPGFQSRADLFIAARSHRKGLKKTLGSSAILDVMFWPRQALLLPRGPADKAQHIALQRYFLWAY